MLKIILIVSIFISSFSLFSQAENNVGELTFSLVMPDQIDGLNYNSLAKLENKIIQSATKYGICGKGLFSDFIIYPVITYNDGETVSGMKNIIVKEMDFSLHIKSVSDNKIFASYGKTLTGAGKSASSACNNAINEIRISDKGLSDFYIRANKKILAYYESRCDIIISKADVLAKMEKFDEAFAILMSIPAQSTDCYSKIKKKSIQVYKSYLDKECKSILMKAKSSKANGYNIDALRLASQIDPSSSCFSEAKQIIKQIESDIDAEEQKQWDLQLKIYDDAIELEKIRIEAIKEIAKSYYESKPTTFNYYDIYIED
tara:strand:+ start:37 stop:984 length:948 start_codon:yes stop_codon:yes gene_type:complete